MRDPVFADDGHTYERDAIQRWFQTRRSSPRTGERLATTRLVPNHATRSAIADWRSANDLPPLPPWVPPSRSPAPTAHGGDDDDDDEDDEDEMSDRRWRPPGAPRQQRFPGGGLRLADAGQEDRQAAAEAAEVELAQVERNRASERAQQRVVLATQRANFIASLDNVALE